MKLMRVYLQGENSGFIELELPARPGYIQDAIDSLGLKENESVYISDYEYLIKNISYDDCRRLDLVHQFTNVFELNEMLDNILASKDPDAAIALLIADMMREGELYDVDDINYRIDKHEPDRLDTDIFNYNPVYEKEYYWYILDVANKELSETISASDAEPYFDVENYVKDMVLGNATVTSTGFLVWHF